MNDGQPMRILVAGATGNLGRKLIPVLHQRGKEVVALVRPGSQSRLQPLGNHITETVVAEITKPDIAASAFRGVHTVISSVGITRQRDGLTYDQVDYGGNLNLLQAAERGGVQRFIYVSVVGADRDVRVPVIQAKRRFEKALIASTLEWLLRAALAVTRVVSRPAYGTLSFLGHVMTHDTTARNHGSRNLEAFFRAQLEAEVR